MENLLLLAQAEGGGMSGAQILFGVVYVGVCFALIGIILTRHPKNDGLGGMMGGGGGDASFRGAKSTEDTVDSIANYVAIAFLTLSVLLNYVF